ncbi:MAG: DUF599 domain-containing protein [Gallionellaceae bacterium]|nr:DUF599 domain-containing protein [Gallionellaceae bacterium]
MYEALSNSTWLTGSGPDELAFLFSVLLVAAYYLHMRQRIQQDPHYSIHAVNALARRLWVENVMSTPGKDVMAVQTLRNFIMVGIMMASTTALLIMGTLTLSGQAENIVRSWHILGSYGSHSAALWIFKVICLLADFLVAFFAYVMSMRLATHVVFMLNVPRQGQGAHPGLSPESVAQRLIQAGNMVAIGMRAFLFAVPIVFWLFGPLFLALASVGLVFFLYHLDRNEAADSRSSTPVREDAHEHDLGHALGSF